MLVNNVDFARQEGSAADRREVIQGRILVEQRPQFLPGILGLDEREVALCELRSAHGRFRWLRAEG